MTPSPYKGGKGLFTEGKSRKRTFAKTPVQLGILEWALWDEARSGAKDQDEEEGLPALNCVMRKAVSQGLAVLCCDWFSLSTPHFL